MTLTDRALPAPVVGRAVPAPVARGPRSRALLDALAGPVHDLAPLPPSDDPLEGDDTPFALYLCYEQHYRSWAGVDPGWEWEPSLLRERRRLESELEQALFARIGPPVPVDPDDVADGLRAVASAPGPSLSGHMAAEGTLGQLREFAVHRSPYQLKEADPHSWGIPRLADEAKAALVLIQFGEYGDGDPARVHARLFAATLRALDLDDAYGAHLDLVPGVTLTTANLISLFGLHRRWRGALVGHLALFEMSSVVPMGRYASALRRHGAGPEATAFYDAHVQADALHQVVALDDMVAGLVAREPELAGDVVFGARALAEVERAFASHLLASWDAGRSSLRRPLA